MTVHLYSPVSLRESESKVRVLSFCNTSFMLSALSHRKVLLGANDSSPRTSQVRVKFNPSLDDPIGVMMADNSGAGECMGTQNFLHHSLQLKPTNYCDCETCACVCAREGGTWPHTMGGEGVHYPVSAFLMALPDRSHSEMYLNQRKIGCQKHCEHLLSSQQHKEQTIIALTFSCDVDHF